MANDVKGGFPSDFATRAEKKEKAWLMQMAKAVYNYASSNKYDFLSRNKKFRNLRKEAEGKIDVDRFKSQLGYAGDTSFMNLSWQVASPIPNIVDKIVGKITQQVYTPRTKAVAPEAVSFIDELKNEKMAEYNRFVEATLIKQVTGIDLKPKGFEFQMTSPEKLEEFLLLNAKTANMVAADKLLQHVMNNTSPRTIEKIVRDIVVGKKAAVKTYVDANDTVQYEYADAAEIGEAYTTDDEFKHLKFMFIRRQLTIDQVITESTKKLSHEEIKAIAKAAAGLSGNPRWDNTWDAYYPESNVNAIYPYSSFTIEVYDIRYASATTLYYREKRTKSGGMYFEEIKNYKPEIKKEGVTITEKPIELAYKCTYVPAAQVIYNYGELENIPRAYMKGGYSPQASFDYTIIKPFMYDMENMSLVERLVPYSDAIIMSLLKMQQIISASRPKGAAFDMAALSEAIKGTNGEYWTFLDHKKFYQQTGDVFYSSFDNVTGTMMPNPRPIMELENGMSQDLERLANQYNFNLKAMHDIVGYSEGADSYQQTENTLVGIQKAMARNNNNALRSTVSALETLLTYSYEKVLCLLEYLIVVADSTSAYEVIIGKEQVDAVKALGMFPFTMLGINLEIQPNYEQQEAFKMFLVEQMRQGLLTSSDVLRAQELIKVSATEAINYLAFRENKYKEEKQKEAERNSQINAQLQQQSAQQKAEQDAQLLQMKMQLEIAKIKAEEEKELKLEMLRHENKMKQLALEGQIKEDHIEAAKQDNPATANAEDLSKSSIPSETGIREPSVAPSSPTKNILA